MALEYPLMRSGMNSTIMSLTDRVVEHNGNVHRTPDNTTGRDDRVESINQVGDRLSNVF
jgi:hypothetical protein